jgi:putative hydrolase
MMYPVDLHMHTVASSHAYSTLQEYISQAENKGIKLLAITDHGPEMADAPHFWHFVNMRIWPRHLSGVAILRGIEANIKNIAGEIDCNSQMYETLDLVIAGFHEQVMRPSDSQTHTQAMIAAMASGKVHIISHPGNPKYPVDIAAIAEAAEHYEVALELNNSSLTHSRKGSEHNCREIALAVKRAGGWLVLGSDSHIAYSLGDFSQCEKILADIDFPAERLLNVTPRRVIDFLQRRTGRVIAEFADL